MPMSRRLVARKEEASTGPGFLRTFVVPLLVLEDHPDERGLLRRILPPLLRADSPLQRRLLPPHDPVLPSRPVRPCVVMQATVAVSYLRLALRRRSLPGVAQSPIGVALGAFVATCSCNLPFIGPLLYFIGLNSLEVSGVLSFLAAYQQAIVEAIVLSRRPFDRLLPQANLALRFRKAPPHLRTGAKLRPRKPPRRPLITPLTQSINTVCIKSPRQGGNFNGLRGDPGPLVGHGALHLRLASHSAPQGDRPAKDHAPDRGRHRDTHLPDG